MEYLPLFHRLKGRLVLLVGGGEVALRKARALVDSGAILRLVAPEIKPQLRQLLADNDKHQLLETSYQTQHLEGVSLVISATNNRSTNKHIAQEAEERYLTVNVVDDAELSSAIFPAIVDRSPLMIAVTSGGTAPVLARFTRAKLETQLPAAYAQLTQLAQKYRPIVKEAIADFQQRRVFWEEVFSGPIAELVFAGKLKAAEEQLETKMHQPLSVQGEVYLIGAGPGDPDLLTFKALRLMQQADVVLYDRLVAKEIVSLCRRDAELIYVGKEKNNHSVPQDEINAKLVELAKKGLRVARLKGGDPFIFGRGGEEIEALAEEGIAFQVVPGITSASGCAAYAGIPLTHRDYAQSVRFVTGHLKEGELELPWQELVNPSQTLVFYMGLGALPKITQELIAHQRDPATPVAVIEEGTTANQRTLIGQLNDIAQLTQEHQFKPPSLIIVGEVVKLHNQLKWFKTETE